MIANSLFNWITFNFSFAMRNIDLFSILWMVIALAIMVGLFVLLIFKSHKLVNLLKLDKNFDDERVEIGNLNPSSIVKLALIIIGGLMIINNIPVFLSQILFAFKRDSMGTEFHPNDYYNFIASGIKVLVGTLILTNYSALSKRLKLKEKTDNLHQ
ncbi:hypothetical protein DWB61_11315 [Ancylomarina euxinus]|uniref:Uncharacterized protein n=2 Tax=Ancylomarina euxinus TaxID=2283627 RepID=A0A425Y052_9BACT|nr:hypothetical protein DWB61_11315 [Ancylomarina euxinus]